MKLALISVSDKEHIIPLTNFILQKDYNILSTLTTYNHIIKNINPKYKNRIISIKDFTDYQDILERNVKALHPKFNRGLLYDPKINIDENNIKPYTLHPISIVVVNLDPFSKIVNNSEIKKSDIIENINICEVSLLRSAAKNYKNVISICNPNDYIHFIENYNDILNSDENKLYFASKSFEYVTDYDVIINNYFNKKINYRKYTQERKIKYGCNPYQHSASLNTINNNKLPITVLNGNPGYTNYLDAFNSWLLVSEASKTLETIVATSFKNNSPAGVAVEYPILNNEKKIYYLDNYDINTINKSLSSRAFLRARYCDALSSFGDFIAICGIVDETCAKLIKKEIIEGIIAEGYTNEALDILKTKKNGNFPIMICDKNINYDRIEYREILGVSLSQECNNYLINKNIIKTIPTKNKNITKDIINDIILATITLKYTISNSITIGENGLVFGIGAGQQNRLDCIKIAGNKANNYRLRNHPKCLKLFDLFKPNIKKQDKINAIEKYINNDFSINELKQWETLFTNTPSILTKKDIFEYLKNNNSNLVLSSDAFLPFQDTIDYAYKYYIKYILNPGGSIQDDKIIQACDKYNIFMGISNKSLFLH